MTIGSCYGHYWQKYHPFDINVDKSSQAEHTAAYYEVCITPIGLNLTVKLISFNSPDHV